MEDELFFVGIPDPIELRKELLTSSKNIIDSLRRHEKYQNIKDQKLQTIMDLKRVFDELLILNKKLRGKLPKIPFKTPKAPKETTPSKPAKGAISKLDILESELSRVEERLKGLE